MTRTHTRSGDIVYLSTRDWLAIVAIVAPILCMLVFGYLRHDRALTELLTRQGAIIDRVDRIESNIDEGGG